MSVKCKIHPRYKVMQQPRVACFDCWVQWLLVHTVGTPQRKEIWKSMKAKGMIG